MSVASRTTCPNCGSVIPGEILAGVDVKEFCPRCSRFAPTSSKGSPKKRVKVVKEVPLAESDNGGNLNDFRNKVRQGIIYAIKLRCPACRQKLELEPSLVGSPFRCPNCTQKLEVEWPSK